MINSFGRSVEKKELKRANKIATKAQDLYENKYSKMNIEELIEEQANIKQIKKEEEKDVNALALFKQVSYLTTGLKPFFVQDVAAYVLNRGCVAEMKTGEGKTLVALIASYLSYIRGQKCHVVTVNDYLANRDFAFANDVFSKVGINISVLLASDTDMQKKSDSYKEADIVYSSNVSLGFDYLRSNLVKDWDDKIINDIDDCFVIVDEVDSVLIDEAKSPLIISGELDTIGEDMYFSLMDVAKKMDGKVINKEESTKTAFEKLSSGGEEYSDYHFVSDKKAKRAHMTEKGYHLFEQELLDREIISSYIDLYKGKINLTNFMEMCLSAISVYKSGVDYIVLDKVEKEGDSYIQLIDQGTGRIMKGRMLSNGLHQAIEAKEGKPISKESKTIAEITYQNLFRLFNKISGMTGTAYEDKKELEDIYGLPVCMIPTRLPMQRVEEKDVLVINKDKKFEIVVDEIIEAHNTGQPILVGTSSVNDSEKLADMLKGKGVKAEVLNAKNHERESEIIAEAGRKGALTISTSMAGRGTDIILGGNLNHLLDGVEDESKAQQIRSIHSEEQKEVINLGGLYVIGFERNKSRRVDDQLKGRAGRQGDPGKSKFFVSLEDDLFQIFGSPGALKRIENMVFSDTDYVTGVSMLDNAIHKSQRQASRFEADIRLSLLKFDDVMDKQRRVFYSMRDDILKMEPDYINLETGSYMNFLREDLEKEIAHHINPLCEKYSYIIDVDEEKESVWLKEKVSEVLDIDVDFNLLYENQKHFKDRGEALFNTLIEQINDKKSFMGSMAFYSFLRIEKINVMDNTWSHLIESGAVMKKSVGLRGYAQKKPEDEYKKETWNMFNNDIILSSTFNAMRTIISDEEVKF
jgi:preprotein translocase subunit SecA